MSDETIFHLARQKPIGDRAAFLDEACGVDLGLRRRVEVLLQAHDNPDNLLESPVPAFGATVIPPAASERTGTVIGPYKLLQQIGEGGMGTVYMAEQTQPVQRKVALKVIKAGMDSRQIIARFEAERQALAMMDHVNIARVLDAGATESGRPYFVMELVHGVPITKYCDDNHLTPRQRLELFVPVCQAIQHAHQKGIIHRDIKPSNVMITLYDGKPVPKVIDFGVAKATEQRLTERTLFTQYGNMVGTLEYMSPEQAEMSALGADTRSDIYSLGVLLYELLTGSTPLSHKRLKEAAFGEILRMIKEEEPPKPSTRLSESGAALASISAQRHMEPAKLAKLMRGELDWIVMKTLEKDRNRRYETANGLAMDVQRYLHDETVQACPPSAGYRFRKFARRSRAALMTTGLVGAAMVVGTGVSVWQAVRATRAEGLAQRRLEREEAGHKETEAAQKEAEANFQKARQAVDDMYTQVAEKWLASQAKLEPLQREFLQKALRFYEEFAQKTSPDPAVRLETAQAFRRVADIQIRLGEVAPAEHAFRQGIDRLQALADEFPVAPEYRQHLAVTLLNFTVLLGNTGRYPDAEKALRGALHLQENLVADFPTVPQYRRDLGRSYNVEGRGRSALRQRPEAEKAFRAALAIQNRLVSEFPSDADYRKDLADSHVALSSFLQNMGRPQEQRQALNEGVGILEKLVAEFPAHPGYRNELATAYYCLAGLLPVQEADSAIRKALDLQEKLAADFPAVTDFRYDLLRSLERQAGLMAGANRIEDAEKAFRRAAAIGDKLVADAPAMHYYRSRRGTVYIRLAALLRKAARMPEAEAVAREALAILSKLAADFPDEPANWDSLRQATAELGNLLREMGRFPEAEKVLRQELDILEKVATHYSTTAYYRNNLAHTYWDLGLRLGSVNQDSDAERAHRQSLAFFDKLAVESPRTPDYSFMRANNYGRLGALLQKAGKLEEAEQEYRRSIELFAMTAADFADIFVDHQWGYNGSRDGLVNLLKATGRAKEVEAVYRNEIDLYARLTERFPKQPELRANQAKVYSEQAKLLSETGRLPEAEAVYRHAIALDEKLIADFPDASSDYLAHLGETDVKLGSLLSAAGRPEEAKKAFRQGADAYRPRTEFYQKLAADFPKNLDNQLQLANCHHDLANLLKSAAQLAEAEQEYRQAVALKEKLVADSPANPDYRFHLAHSHLGLAYLFGETKRPEEAEKHFRQALALFQKLADDFPGEPARRHELANRYNELGKFLAAAGRLPETETAFHRSMEIYEKLVSDFPADRSYHEGLGHSARLLAFRFDQITRSADREKLWRRAAKEFEESVSRAADTPSSQQARFYLADTYRTLADELAAQKRPVEAEKLYHLALDHYDKLVAESPDNGEFRTELGHLLWHTGDFLSSAKRSDEAGHALRRALSVFEKLAVDFPTKAFYRFEQGVNHWKIGDLMRDFGRLPHAEESYRKALAIYAKLSADFPNDAEYRSRLARSHVLLIDVLLPQGRHAEAAKLAVELPRVNPDKWDEHQRAAGYLENCVALAQKDESLSSSDRKAVAEAYGKQAAEALRQGIGMIEKRAIDHPDDRTSREMLDQSYQTLGRMLSSAGRTAEAKSAYRQGADRMAKLASEFPDVAWYREAVGHHRRLLAFTMSNTGDAQDKEKAFREAVQIFEQLATDDPKQPKYRDFVAGTHRALGEMFAANKRPEEAEESYRKALAVYAKLSADFPNNTEYRSRLAQSHVMLIDVLLPQGRHAEAAKLAIELSRVSPDKSDSLRAAVYLEQCAAVAQKDASLSPSDRKAAVEAYAKQAAELMSEAGKRVAGNGQLENQLAWTLVTNAKPELRSPARAVELARKAVELAPADGGNWNTLGVAHYREGHWQEAIDALTKAEELLVHKYFSFNAFFLAMAHRQLGHKEEARKWYDQSVEWMDKNKPNDEELRRFREEAAKLLKVEDPPKPVPISK